MEQDETVPGTLLAKAWCAGCTAPQGSMVCGRELGLCAASVQVGFMLAENQLAGVVFLFTNLTLYILLLCHLDNPQQQKQKHLDLQNTMFLTRWDPA